MATVTITLTDTEAGVEQIVNFGDEFDNNSAAHHLATLMLNHMDDEIRENNASDSVLFGSVVSRGDEFGRYPT